MKERREKKGLNLRERNYYYYYKEKTDKKEKNEIPE